MDPDMAGIHMAGWITPCDQDSRRFAESFDDLIVGVSRIFRRNRG